MFALKMAQEREGSPVSVCWITPQSVGQKTMGYFLSSSSLMLILLLSHTCAVTVNSADLGLQNNNIFILAGQSNMAGRGGVVNETWDGIVPSGSRPNPSILRLTAGLTWVEAREPLHADIDTNKTCGIGPGMVFANVVLKEDPVFGIVGLVPCAVGGTNISQWSRGTYLYTQLVRRAKASLQNGGKIRALLWYQGESDSESRENAESYKGKLEKFILDLRTDLQSPTLPVIQAYPLFLPFRKPFLF